VHHAFWSNNWGPTSPPACGLDTQEFLDLFRGKNRAILVSAQMLLEGFDDPVINAVVIAYPSSSLIRLMQAAGRCVRYAPGKTDAFVIQAQNIDLGYYYDEGWPIRIFPTPSAPGSSTPSTPTWKTWPAKSGLLSTPTEPTSTCEPPSSVDWPG